MRGRQNAPGSGCLVRLVIRLSKTTPTLEYIVSNSLGLMISYDSGHSKISLTGIKIRTNAPRDLTLRCNIQISTFTSQLHLHIHSRYNPNLAIPSSLFHLITSTPPPTCNTIGKTQSFPSLQQTTQVLLHFHPFQTTPV
jgi:hypothetical protein